MTDQRENDEILLIDSLLGRCDGGQQELIRRRLADEPELRRLRDDLRNTFAAMGQAVEYEPPAHLVESTMARVRSARQTDALLAREQLNRRDVIRPTFSLRELSAVAGVLLLVFTIFGVSYRDAQRREDQRNCANRLAELGAALRNYANTNGGYLPATGVQEARWLPASGQPAVSNSTGLFRLVKLGYVSAPSCQCPAVGGDSFVVQAGMVDFPASRFIGFSYHHSLGTKGLWTEDPRLMKVAKSMAILADSTPLFAGGQFHPDRVRAPVSENHHGEGQNVLYLDTHVEFRQRPCVGVQGDNIYLAEGIYSYDGDEAPTGPTDTFLLPAFPNDAGR